MAQTPPFRNRPRLHLALAPLTGSPRPLDQSISNSSKLPTPLSITAYSPFRSAGLKPPTPYGGLMQFNPRPSRKPNGRQSYVWFRVRRAVKSKSLWLFLLIGILTLWCFSGADELNAIRLNARKLGNGMFAEERTRGLQFFPATNPKIHVCFLLDHGKDSLLIKNSMLVVGQQLQIDSGEMAHFQASSRHYRTVWLKRRLM